ncbi:hypothetical protein [Ethanoligenens harbinense]|uniref:Uncharacterized protein n=1 Tax=Ethanoligenens harbinense (strain DSM 18485 / JCM 12961 / CGMCC 1.5033 / YUAN-3) TaxID=663278 RepID=E6U728_ETHHY|nr:hypothetical protein [Ethanoligenens harbinense]ADU28098.1 hypothetical protein Ethha_2605 [Ethanoligenens harbinense YUAN-3]AYF39769.1 hypothetical protein CXP51_13285 [Ethanoligenens harbinense]AYF42601.1 hypothetical protein CN246_13865 [Ethanoligenens harbinense]
MNKRELHRFIQRKAEQYTPDVWNKIEAGRDGRPYADEDVRIQHDRRIRGPLRIALATAAALCVATVLFALAPAQWFSVHETAENRPSSGTSVAPVRHAFELVAFAEPVASGGGGSSQLQNGTVLRPNVDVQIHQVKGLLLIPGFGPKGLAIGGFGVVGVDIQKVLFAADSGMLTDDVQQDRKGRSLLISAELAKAGVLWNPSSEMIDKLIKETSGSEPDRTQIHDTLTVTVTFTDGQTMTKTVAISYAENGMVVARVNG